MFSQEDHRQIARHGLSFDAVLKQIERFQKGFPQLELDRPCRVGDGLRKIDDQTAEFYVDCFNKTAPNFAFGKFVPASGAATRMFAALLQALETHDFTHVRPFFNQLSRFAFFDALAKALHRCGRHLNSLLINQDYAYVLEFMLTPAGLNYAHLPKGLIPFHKYENEVRTPVAEHLSEAGAYSQNRVQFSINPQFETEFRTLVKKAEKLGNTDFDVSFSYQKASTDTIAVDHDRKPFRTDTGRLVFRPGGHGALIENINDLNLDFVFIKNIDNVVPDYLKPETIRSKKILGGLLLDLQSTVFNYLHKIAAQNVTDEIWPELVEFSKKEFGIIFPVDFAHYSLEQKREEAFKRLNRPLRVCGMVRNAGEPGGGPFWVRHKAGEINLQIVEQAQIDENDPEQQTILSKATHFNPVDLVCGLRDFRGQSFDLSAFIDQSTGIITRKFQSGRELYALEHPGLWNGSMADWLTVFVEVPLITFNPVKTVMDLLRPEHSLADHN